MMRGTYSSADSLCFRVPFPCSPLWRTTSQRRTTSQLLPPRTQLQPNPSSKQVCWLDPLLASVVCFVCLYEPVCYCQFTHTREFENCHHGLITWWSEHSNEPLCCRGGEAYHVVTKFWGLSNHKEKWTRQGHSDVPQWHSLIRACYSLILATWRFYE